MSIQEFMESYNVRRFSLTIDLAINPPQGHLYVTCEIRLDDGSIYTTVATGTELGYTLEELASKCNDAMGGK